MLRWSQRAHHFYELKYCKSTVPNQIVLGRYGGEAINTYHSFNDFSTARETRTQQLEKLFGAMEVPFSDRPMLEVKLPDAVPEAFEMVLNYIYTDRIDCKLVIHSLQSNSKSQFPQK